MSKIISPGQIDNSLSGYREIIETIQNISLKMHCRVVLVGGPVRDLILKKIIIDLDLMVDHPARDFVQAVAQSLKGDLISHERFYTFTIKLSENLKIDIATARTEEYPIPSGLPVVTPSAIEKDLKRRDFTINAMAMHLSPNQFGELIDPFEGETDLRAGIIKVLHDQSFTDDPTRVFRAARFAGRFDFFLSSPTDQLIQEAIKHKLTLKLSPIRRRHEFELILKELNPIPGLKRLQQWNALAGIHPEWENLPFSLASFEQAISNKKSMQERLWAWFSPWGAKKAESLMTQLEFDKTSKRRFLAGFE